MKTQKIQFGGSTYTCRLVNSKDGEELIIAPTTLLDALQPGSFEDENEGFASLDAEELYDEIFFFTDKEILKRPDKELIDDLKKDNPEWFK